MTDEPANPFDYEEDTEYQSAEDRADTDLKKALYDLGWRTDAPHNWAHPRDKEMHFYHFFLLKEPNCSTKLESAISEAFEAECKQGRNTVDVDPALRPMVDFFHWKKDRQAEFPSPALAPARDALRKLLNDLATGSAKVRPTSSRALTHVHFETTDGWKFTVRNTDGTFHLLHSAEDPQGRVLDWEEISAIDGVDWGLVECEPSWRTLLKHDETDPEFPNPEAEAK
jgi:hypothetical protein